MSATKAKAMLEADPALKAAALAAYGRLCDRIETRAAAVRPKMKVFEVHHETQAARTLFLDLIAAGRQINDAENKVLDHFNLS